MHVTDTASTGDKLRDANLDVYVCHMLGVVQDCHGLSLTLQHLWGQPGGIGMIAPPNSVGLAIGYEGNKKELCISNCLVISIRYVQQTITKQ